MARVKESEYSCKPAYTNDIPTFYSLFGNIRTGVSLYTQLRKYPNKLQATGGIFITRNSTNIHYTANSACVTPASEDGDFKIKKAYVFLKSLSRLYTATIVNRKLIWMKCDITVKVNEYTTGYTRKCYLPPSTLPRPR